MHQRRSTTAAIGIGALLAFPLSVACREDKISSIQAASPATSATEPKLDCDKEANKGKDDCHDTKSANSKRKPAEKGVDKVSSADDVGGVGAVLDVSTKKSEATSVASPGLDVQPFELGPFLHEALVNPPATQISLEYGYLDMRSTKSGGIFDYRLRHAAVIAAPSHLPTDVAAGCSDVSNLKAKTSGTTATAVNFAGATSGKANLDPDKVFRIATKTNAPAFDFTKLVEATVTDAAGNVEVESPVVPQAGTIQVAGAFDTNVSVNTNLADFSRNLSESNNPLMFADVGNGKNYTQVVVIVYGGVGAKRQTVRCVMDPNGSVKIEPAVYKELLPLRAVVGYFANVVVKNEDGKVTWSAAIAGQGVEDPR